MPTWIATQTTAEVETATKARSAARRRNFLPPDRAREQDQGAEGDRARPRSRALRSGKEPSGRPGRRSSCADRRPARRFLGRPRIAAPVLSFQMAYAHATARPTTSVGRKRRSSRATAARVNGALLVPEVERDLEADRRRHDQCEHEPLEADRDRRGRSQTGPAAANGSSGARAQRLSRTPPAGRPGRTRSRSRAR